jgi:hypothetical protein
MSSKVKQSKAGIPEKPRGQQTGGPGNPDKNQAAKADTPALRGIRKEENEMFADESMQQVGANPSNPRSNTPSTPAAIPGDQPVGESGGERVFKERTKTAKG